MGIIKCFNDECHYHDLEEADHCSKPLHKILKCNDSIYKEIGKGYESAREHAGTYLEENVW